jgi:DNA-binding PadR family transcriptional regulator
MPENLSLTYTTGLILWTMAEGASYGFQIMDTTGLPSGTVYPALRRLEAAGFVESGWGRRQTRSAGPPRKHYRLTRRGVERLELLCERFPLLARTGE